MTLVYYYIPTNEIHPDDFEAWLTENTISPFDVNWLAKNWVCFTVNFTNNADVFLLQCKFPPITLEYD